MVQALSGALFMDESLSSLRNAHRGKGKRITEESKPEFICEHPPSAAARFLLWREERTGSWLNSSGWASALLFWLALTLSPASAFPADKKERQHEADSMGLFTTATVLQLHLDLPTPAIVALKGEPRKFVRATVREGEGNYKEVGVHLKGVGSFRPIDEKPSFTLKFNHFTSGQRFHGLTKVMLNNSVQDPSYIDEALCTRLFREAGVPAARVTHARVWLNDRYLGLYVLVEGLSKEFLSLNFKNRDGALYEPYLKDIDEELKQNHGDDTSRADLKALIQATQVADASARWERLQKVLDVDRFISMMAGEILMAHWDGYWMNHNNYRIYHDTTRDKMVLIPYGLDSMFQQPAMAWQPTQQTLLVQAVLQTSEGQRRYREQISSLARELFTTESLQKRVGEIAARLRPVIAQDKPDVSKQWEKEVSGLREHIAERMKFLAGELPPSAPR